MVSNQKLYLLDLCEYILVCGQLPVKGEELPLLLRQRLQNARSVHHKRKMLSAQEVRPGIAGSLISKLRACHPDLNR